MRIISSDPVAAAIAFVIAIFGTEVEMVLLAIPITGTLLDFGFKFRIRPWNSVGEQTNYGLNRSNFIPQ